MIDQLYLIAEALVRDGIGSVAGTIVRGVSPELSAQLGSVFRGAPDWTALKLLAMQVSLALSMALAAFIVYVRLKESALAQQIDASEQPSGTTPAMEAAPMGQLRERWNGILTHLDSPRENDWKVAVIEADKLMDDALARAGFAGDTFGDRLMNIQAGTLVSLDGVWWAHKVRNRLAHEPDYFLRYTEARQAIGYFEAALSELAMI
jgi:hypothetical protein